MAEMTAAEAIRTAWKFNQPQLVKFIECQESKEKLLKQQIEYCTALIEQQAAKIEQARATIDTHSELIDHYKRRAEQAETENKRLRVCSNCRHFEWPKCTVSGKRTTRASICRDWEMV